MPGGAVPDQRAGSTMPDQRTAGTQPGGPGLGPRPGGAGAGQLAGAASGQSAGEAPFASPVQEARTRPGRPSRGGAGRNNTGRGGAARTRAAGSRRAGAARVAIRPAPSTAIDARPIAAAARQQVVQQQVAQQQAAGQPSAAGLPWYEVAHTRRVVGGHRNCGPLEKVLCRDWEDSTLPPPEVVRAIDRLAELPASVSERLAGGLDAIYVGPGGVPDLDDMGRLRGVPLPSGRATWDACAGAYGERKIIIGTRPSSTPDVVCHEVGHALDDLDGSGGMWQSDSDEFRALYGRCLSRLVSDFHRQEGALGRREFFADAFAAIASSQRPALVDMLGGNTRIALDVMLYFNVRYGI
jgi:hypothetical protein